MKLKECVASSVLPEDSSHYPIIEGIFRRYNGKSEMVAGAVPLLRNTPV
jgi:hypothetical protein